MCSVDSDIIIMYTETKAPLYLYTGWWYGLDQQSYSMPGPVSTGMSDCVRGSTPGTGNLSQYKVKVK